MKVIWSWCLASLLLLDPLSAAGPRLRITEPASRDIIVVTESEATIRGTKPNSDHKLEVEVNDRKLPEGEISETAGGKWSFKVKLADKTTKVRVSWGVEQPEFVYFTRAANLKKKGRPLKVRFKWDDGVDDLLMQIAAETLSAPPSNAFVRSVRDQTPKFFSTAFNDIDMTVIEGTGAAHLVCMLPKSGEDDRFGGATTDCMDKKNGDDPWASKVYVRKIQERICREFDYWKPMKRSDPWPLRAEDIAYILAWTAAHETGHALGLVSNDGDCNWLEGNSRQHHNTSDNRRESDVTWRVRFDGGRYLMDEDVPNYLMLGAESERRDYRNDAKTSSERRDLQFCPFDLAYLKILYPED